MESSTLQGTIVLVTGAAGGLGKAIAKAYIDAGASVAVCDINEERLAATESEFESTGRFLAVKTDITDEPAVQALVDKVITKFGRLDIIVNNAGVMDRFDPVADLSKSTWDNVLSINLTGSFLVAKTAVKAFQIQAQPGGIIIQIGSNASHSGQVSGLAYTVSKHGVQGLVKHTASYYENQGIYTVGLMLGAMPDTNISEAMRKNGVNKEAYSAMAVSGPNPKNFIKLEDVGKYAVFLADRGVARSANGSCIAFHANWPRA